MWYVKEGTSLSTVDLEKVISLPDRASCPEKLLYQDKSAMVKPLTSCSFISPEIMIRPS